MLNCSHATVYRYLADTEPA
ncbi:hypothetical protein [Nocardia amamiensis]|nr:hypothetical protein [Nocardia amamiensis]